MLKTRRFAGRRPCPGDRLRQVSRPSAPKRVAEPDCYNPHSELFSFQPMPPTIPSAFSELEEYPADNAGRDRWILARRSGRRAARADQPKSVFVEMERAESGEIVPTATIFLTNRECPWHCLMCDLWQNTLTETVPLGAIPRQIDYGLEKLGLAADRDRAARPQLKLYNAGSFFDARAIPPADYGPIAERVRPFHRVIVECHPALVGDPCLRFRDALARGKPAPLLEVALGLETAHPEVLAKLNKRMTPDQFRRAAAFLTKEGIAVRAFVLVKPPFLDEASGLSWAQRSVAFAFAADAGVVSLIPTRAGNGALEALRQLGQFSPPKLSSLESAQEYGIRLRRGRVFADLWDLQQFSQCDHCFEARRARFHRMNLEQVVIQEVPCAVCQGGGEPDSTITRRGVC
jgi:archaeosine synthase beta-subunit